MSIAKLDGNRSTLNSKIASLNGKLAGIKQDISVKKLLQVKLAGLEATEQKVQSSLAKLNSALAAAQNEKKAEQADIENKKKQVIDLDAQIRKLTKINATFAAQLSSIQGKLLEAKSQYATLKKNNDKLVGSILDKEQSEIALTAKIRKLQAELSSVKQLNSDTSETQK